MSTVSVVTGLFVAGRLIPFRCAGASRLTGTSCRVLTPSADLPEMFRAAQQSRTMQYLYTGSRVTPVDAPRYIVTSYGVPIAWVTLDGRTHYADLPAATLSTSSGAAAVNTMLRHRTAIMRAWPERFVLDSQGDPVPVRADEYTLTDEQAADIADQPWHGPAARLFDPQV